VNLHGLVRNAIGIVNPDIPGTLQRSMGYTTAPDGTRSPAYQTEAVTLQVQALTEQDLRQVEGLNIQGEMRRVYVYGQMDGAVRPDRKGGDILTFNAQRWLVVQVVEQWPGWASVIVARQV
jgi:hypothetical protein